jgi:hypothetical protein
MTYATRAGAIACGLALLCGAASVACDGGSNEGNNNQSNQNNDNQNNDNQALCGDGVLDTGEACDGAELGGETCATQQPGSVGTLTCTPLCQLDASGCTLCGNGVASYGEACDCGTDPNNLPMGCDDVNGGPGANCDVHCNAIQTGDCCVVVQGLGATDVVLCEGPTTSGTPTATPSIQLNPNAITLHAGLDQTQAHQDALLVVLYQAQGAGDYTNPMVEYWNDSGTWFENNAMDGAAHIDAWTAPGTEITGTFSDTAYNMGGPGPDHYDITGTFCAVRLPDAP